MSAKLTCISTGSHGNNYILDVSGEKLIIELGIKLKDIIKALDYKLDNVVGCLCSHAHKDHSFAVPNALSYGLDVYSCHEVNALYPKVKALEPKKRYAIGGFKVMPLLLEHNVECYGYVIDHSEMGRLAFCTDAKTLPYCLPNVNVLMIEANYSEELIIDRLCEGKDVRSSFDTHMSLDTCISVIKRLQSPELRKTILLHLSDSNSDERAFKQRVWQECGIRCECAENGTVYELTKDDF